MKRTIATLITIASTVLFSAEPITKERLLEKLQGEMDKSILYQERIAEAKEIEAGVHIAMNLSSFCKTAVPLVIDKYILLQEEAFAYGNAHPEALEDQTLILPETPLSK